MENKLFIDKDEIIFALDIGTRTVVGIVGVAQNNKLKVIDVEVMEHDKRVMKDGQIQDIDGVTQTVAKVKTRLEEKLGIKLKKVAIAAAGRVLRTFDVKVEKEIDMMEEITAIQASEIEFEAILRAQNEFVSNISESEGSNFYCVGHSITSYYLDGFPIISLVGHRGKKIGISVLATFLPSIVVESLYAVINKVGLVVSSLTLEPIAAISVAIPKELRILNLALVDVGAGTSDIAITKDGTVVAYSMVPVAGDEITESIAENYLVDFNTAERIKLSLGNKNVAIPFEDVIGKKHSIMPEEVEIAIKPAITYLADVIVARILESNNKPTNAVFLIGGGSQIPGLPEAIANKLGIPEERVAIRGRDTIKEIDYKENKFEGPEAITPFGIAVTELNKSGNEFIEVVLNEVEIKLFATRNLTVADVAGKAAFEPSQLIGRTGKSVVFYLNGVKKVIRGDLGKQAEIFINDVQASLDSRIKNKDKIKIIPASEGSFARIFVKDLVTSIRRGSVSLNGTYINLDAKVIINGKNSSINAQILEGDRVDIVETDTVAKLLEDMSLSNVNTEIMVNGKKVSQEFRIAYGDIINVGYNSIDSNANVVSYDLKGTDKTYKDSYNSDYLKGDEILVDDIYVDDISAEGHRARKYNVNSINKDSLMGNKVEYFTVSINGIEHLLKKNKTGNFFVEVLSQINFNLDKLEGTLIMKLNGTRAGFIDAVTNGDSIEIYWD